MILAHYCVTLAIHERASHIGAAIAAAAATAATSAAAGTDALAAATSPSRADARRGGSRRPLFTDLALSSPVDALFPFAASDGHSQQRITDLITPAPGWQAGGRGGAEAAGAGLSEGRDEPRRGLRPRAAPRQPAAAPPGGLGPLPE